MTRGLGDPPFTDEDQNLMELFHLEVARLERQELPEGGERLTRRERDVLRASRPAPRRRPSLPSWGSARRRCTVT